MSPSARELRDEGRIVLLFAGMKARVLEQRKSPGFIAATARSAASPTQSSTNLIGRFKRMRDFGGDGLERILGVAPLGPAEMREQDHLGALVGELGDRRRHALDAGRVGDHAVFRRHVEVGAHEHALALHVGMVEGSKRGHGPSRRRRQISLPIATAVSAMRLEKPHSLSYHDITRTNVPSITLVWSMWKIEECGSWLKSSETLGSSV